MADSFVAQAGEKPSAGFWPKHRRTTFLTISSALLAVAPKCPICFLAYFGIFGVATASTAAYRAWLPLITSFWLALTIAMLAFQRGRKLRYGPAILGLVAGALLMTGKFLVESQSLIVSGLGLLLAAAVWRVRLQQTVPAEVCSQCEELPRASVK